LLWFFCLLCPQPPSASPWGSMGFWELEVSEPQSHLLLAFGGGVPTMALEEEEERPEL
jgi:hypothetical protein